MIDQDLEEIRDLLGEEKKVVPAPVDPQLEEIKLSGSFEKIDKVSDEGNKFPGEKSISSIDAREIVIEKSNSNKTPEKAIDIEVNTPLPPAPVEPAAPPREPWFFETLFKEYVIDIIKDIWAGIVEVATDVYVFIRDYKKPVPPTPLESLLARHEAI